MKKIATLIAATVVASAANAGFITNMDIDLTSVQQKSSFSPKTLVTGAITLDSLQIQIDTQGAVFNGGTITGSYGFNVNAASFSNITNTYTNVTYNIAAGSGTTLDTNYQGSGNTLVQFRLGANPYDADFTAPYNDATNSTRDISAVWPTAVAPGVAMNNTNAAATSSGTVLSSTGVGAWAANTLGLEGIVLTIVVDGSFNFISGTIAMNEFTGSSGSAQTQLNGNLSLSAPTVPVPAAAWLMGSGLVGLAGIARRRKMA